MQCVSQGRFHSTTWRQEIERLWAVTEVGTSTVNDNLSVRFSEQSEGSSTKESGHLLFIPFL